MRMGTYHVKDVSLIKNFKYFGRPNKPHDE